MQTGGNVYILASLDNKSLYVGVTSDLFGRVEKHKNKFYVNSYTSRKCISKLVYYESFETITDAIVREKQLKKYSHLKKVLLIIALNPKWEDLHEKIRYV
ncbi:MAG TPA: GIY-YIG nuclease family protein [Chryseosolibacter sp.]